MKEGPEGVRRRVEDARLDAEILEVKDEHSIRASDIKPRNIDWLWKHRLARGKIQLIAGMPDAGKSMLATTLAGIMTKGLKWPNGEGALQRALDVLLYEAEDDIEDTIVPRLAAAGADLDRVMIRKPPHIPTPNLLALYDVVIVSPMIDLASGDNNSEKDVRNSMAPWVEACSKQGKAVIGLAHCNKKADLDVLHRVLGSQAWGAIVRLGFWMERDDDGTTRHLLPLKGNIAPDGLPGLMCKPNPIGPYDQSVYMKWLGTSDKGSRRKPAPTSLEAEILRMFGEGVTLRTAQIYKLVPDEDKGEVRKALANMVKKGILWQPEYANYAQKE